MMMMAEVEVNAGESIESALKRFKKKIQKAGILSEIKRRERYEPPSLKRKRKAQSARKRKRQFQVVFQFFKKKSCTIAVQLFFCFAFY